MLYISHHLEEVFEICQEVSVIRDGQLVRAVCQPRGTPSLIVDRLTAISPNGSIVDVAAKSLLLGELAEITADSAAGLLLVTDELADLEMCDRVIVLVRGEVFAEFTDPPFDREALIAATEGLTQ